MCKLVLDCIKTFQSTLPVRGATSYRDQPQPAPVFQSTLPVRGATIPEPVITGDVDISIHAPREGSDRIIYLHLRSWWNFNPRSP